MDFRGQVRKWVSMITCIFWSEIVSGFGYIHAYPHQEFPGTPPPPPGHEDIGVLGQFCAEVIASAFPHTQNAPVELGRRHQTNNFIT